MPLVHAFRTSSHRKTQLDHILVELEDASGAIGWGEIASPSDPYYAPETVETCWHIAEHHLLPAVLGKPWRTEQVAQLWAKVRGNQFAKAGVDVAAWVCCGRLCTRSRSRRHSAGPAARSSPGCRWGSSRRSATCSPRYDGRWRRLPTDQAEDRAGLGRRAGAPSGPTSPT